jgi:hypothetical protein
LVRSAASYANLRGAAQWSRAGGRRGQRRYSMAVRTGAPRCTRVYLPGRKTPDVKFSVPGP